MTSDDLCAISADWLKSLEVASSTGDVASFVSHFLSNGWIRDLLCFSWNFRSLSGPNEIHGFLSEVVDGKPRIKHSGLRDFKLDDHTVNAPSPFKLPGPQGIEGVQGAFTFSITQPAALGRGFFRLTQDVDGRWKALTLFTNMQDLVGYEESLADQHGLYEDRGITWEEDVDARFRAIEADPTVLIIGGGISGLMTAAQLRRLGIRALVIEKNARVGDSWRQRYPNLTLHTPADYSSMLYSPYPSTFPKYIPKGKLANFLDSYAVDHELCIWLSSRVQSTPVHDSSSARWTVEVQRGDRTVFINPKHVVLATGSGSPRIPTWNGMDEFQGALYHSDFHKDAKQFRGKHVVVVGAGNASADICQDFVAHGAAEVTMIQGSATCVVSSSAMEQTHFKPPFLDGTPIEEFDFLTNSMPLAFLLQVQKSCGVQHMKMLDKELHEALSKVGFNLTWEISPGGGEVGFAEFLFKRLGSGTMLDIGCGKLIIEGKVKIKQGQDISHLDKDGITFKDDSKLPADVIVLATGNEPIMETARALLGNEITEQLPPEVWGLDSEGELNQIYRPSGHPGLWFAIGGFAISRFFSKHLVGSLPKSLLGPEPSGTSTRTPKKSSSTSRSTAPPSSPGDLLSPANNQNLNLNPHWNPQLSFGNLDFQMPGGRRSTSMSASSTPASRTSSPTYNLNTRRTTRTTLSQEAIEAMANTVKNTDSGKKYLESKLLCLIDEPFTLTHLISILFQITQMSGTIPATVTAAIRAVAFIMKNHVTDEIAERVAETAAGRVADRVAKRITESISTKMVDHVIAAISPQVALVHSASQSLSSLLEQATELHTKIERERTEGENNVRTAVERIEESADALFSYVETCQGALKSLGPSLEIMHNQVNTMSQKLSAPVTTSQPTALHPSYSSIAATPMSPTVDKALGRAAIRARKILLDPLPGESLFPPDTSKHDIAKKLNEALDKAHDDSTPKGKVKAITILRNGGLITEMESESLASWLNTMEGKAALVSNLDISVSFRHRTYLIVLEYLPVQLQLDDAGFPTQVEQENNLPPDTIASIRWIKPLTKCSAEQRKAFALMHITDIHLANNILRDSICIDNERISICKDKKEPLHCAKCQRFNHIAKNCSATQDVCGTCGGDHRTSACCSYRTTRCVNCWSQQHTSWNCNCPEFTKCCKDIDDKYPENRMPYFPTEHIWTQITQPAKTMNSSNPPDPSQTSSPQQRKGNTSLRTRQSTINFPWQMQPWQPEPRTCTQSPQLPQDDSIHDLITQGLTFGDGTHPTDSSIPTPSNNV